MVKYNSGFDLAELDLQMRGPGEVYGVKQSGIPDLKIASFTNLELLTKVRSYAQRLIDEDFHLSAYVGLSQKIAELEASMELGDVS